MWTRRESLHISPRRPGVTSGAVSRRFPGGAPGRIPVLGELESATPGFPRGESWVRLSRVEP